MHILIWKIAASNLPDKKKANKIFPFESVQKHG